MKSSNSFLHRWWDSGGIQPGRTFVVLCYEFSDDPITRGPTSQEIWFSIGRGYAILLHVRNLAEFRPEMIFATMPAAIWALWGGICLAGVLADFFS